MTVMERLLAEFKHRVRERGAPEGMSIEDLVLNGYATMAEADTLMGAMEAWDRAMEGEDQ